MGTQKSKILYPLVVFVLLLVGGTIVFNITEGWSYLDSLYFSVATISTLGYGDLVPTQDISKIIVIFYSLTGIGIFLYFVSIITRFYLEESSPLHIRGRFSRLKKLKPTGNMRKEILTEKSVNVKAKLKKPPKLPKKALK